jgi:hypothetical protein
VSAITSDVSLAPEPAIPLKLIDNGPDRGLRNYYSIAKICTGVGSKVAQHVSNSCLRPRAIAFMGFGVLVAALVFAL